MWKRFAVMILAVYGISFLWAWDVTRAGDITSVGLGSRCVVSLVSLIITFLIGIIFGEVMK